MIHVIWIIWSLASWKDTVAEYIHERLGRPIFQVSDVLKKIATDQKISPTRENLWQLSRDISDKWDEYLVKVIIESLPSHMTHIIIAGMRQLGQIDYLKQHATLQLIWVDADITSRFNRAKERNKLWDATSLDEFMYLENLDNSHIQNVSSCLALCDMCIDNSWTQDALYTQIDTFLLYQE